MVTLTEYVSVIGVPSNPRDVKASEYTFTTVFFDAPAHSTVPELAELTVQHCPADVRTDGARIVRISRVEPEFYIYDESWEREAAQRGWTYWNNWASGTAQIVLYRDSIVDPVYEQYIAKRNSSSFGPSIPDEEIPF